MTQILCCDWLTERARWSYTARSGFLAWSRQIKDNFFGVLSHIINPLLAKLIRSVSCVFMDLDFVSANMQPS